MNLSYYNGIIHYTMSLFTPHSHKVADFQNIKVLIFHTHISYSHSHVNCLYHRQSLTHTLTSLRHIKLEQTD